MKTNNILRSLALAAVIVSASCSEWTQTESLDLTEPGLEYRDPAAYEAYLSRVRAYKADKHRILFAWFDNAGRTPATQAYLLKALPDSLDIVSLTTPEQMPEWQLRDMRAIQERKATRVIYTIDNDALNAEWEALLKEEAPEEDSLGTDSDTPDTGAETDADSGSSAEEAPDETERYAAFVAERLSGLLACCDTYGFDGIELRYIGSSTTVMNDRERAEYAARQRAFLAPVAEWAAAHPDKLFVFTGKPEHLLDVSLAAACDYIVLASESAADIHSLTRTALMTLIDGVPSDRFLAAVELPDPQGKDPVQGYFDSELAIRAAAEWTLVQEHGIAKAGIAVRDVQNDYYDANLVYRHVREAIGIMNPSL